jgi:hypothetical protein
VNKLNIFMVNVLRFKGSSDMSSLVDKAGSHNKRFDIYSGTNDENGNGGADGVKAKAAEKELAGAGR